MTELPFDFCIYYLNYVTDPETGAISSVIETYSSLDGSAFDAPEYGVIAIVVKAQNHLWTLHLGDSYRWYEHENTWRGGDKDGEKDYLMNYPGQKKVIYGRYVSNEDFNATLKRVYDDMPPKNGWEAWETPPPVE